MMDTGSPGGRCFSNQCREGKSNDYREERVREIESEN